MLLPFSWTCSFLLVPCVTRLPARPAELLYVAFSFRASAALQISLLRRRASRVAKQRGQLIGETIDSKKQNWLWEWVAAAQNAESTVGVGASFGSESQVF